LRRTESISIAVFFSWVAAACTAFLSASEPCVAGGAIVYQNRRFENVSGKVKRRRQKQAAAGAV
jgi:hypothetical protein